MALRSLFSMPGRTWSHQMLLRASRLQPQSYKSITQKDLSSVRHISSLRDATIRPPRLTTMNWSKSSRNLTQYSVATMCISNSPSNCSHSYSSYSPSQHSPSTVYAMSSGRGRCGVAVVRVSGPEAGTVLLKLGRFRRLPTPRRTVLRRIHHPDTGRVLDKALIIWFLGPASFTGEDSCELHVHGGPAVVAAVLDAIQAVPGLEPAEPGDFTRRAFSQGKLDLTEVEGLADLIHAETEAQRQQALRQMDGDLSSLYADWRQTLVKCAANVAAYVDFSEDELIEDDVLHHVTHGVERLRAEISAHLDDHRRGERLRDGVHVAIVGEPNVGKSSLLNVLCRRPAAIVSPMAGTTRDVVESAVNLGGYPVLLSDTAGLRETGDMVEQEGVRRAIHRALTADLRVVVLDAGHLLPPPGGAQPELHCFLQRHLQALGLNTLTEEASLTGDLSPEPLNTPHDEGTPSNALSSPRHRDPGQSGTYAGGYSLFSGPESSGRLMVVVNKMDLVDRSSLQQVLQAAGDRGAQSGGQWTAVSCTTGDGLDDFLDQLTCHVKDLCGNPAVGNPSLTQARHRTHLVACLKALTEYLTAHNRDLVVGGEHLRQAVYQMGKLTGRITSEEVLDVVFRDFCIGK